MRTGSAFWVGSLGGLVTVLAVFPVNAAPITWAFTGTITGVGDPNHQLDGSVVVGTPFSGTYTFESTMTDDLPDDPTVGLYTQPRPATSIMVLDLGTYHLVGQSSELRVEKKLKGGLGFQSLSFLSDPFGLYGMGVGLRDRSGDAFANDALPLVPPPLEIFDSALLGINGGYTPQGHLGIGGTLDTLTLVPEPMCLCLFAAGLAFVSRRPDRRSCS